MRVREFDMRFQDKTAVVTGGGGGIGGAVCTAFANEGADVAVMDIDLVNAESVAAEINKTGRKGLAFRVDVSNFTEVMTVAKKIKAEFGHIDILVNTAGVPNEYMPLSQMTEEEWDRSLAINLKGVFNATRAFVNDMIDQKYGKIINISSVAGMHGAPNMSPYSTAKAGIIGMSKALAKEVTTQGINVNVIAPGPVITPFNAKMDQEHHKKALEATPVGRGGTPEEIAALALFLASEEAGFIVGQVISPNGGRFL